MIEIKTQPIKDSIVTVPGSKSYTHRILIAAALSDGVCEITNPLRSDDTLLTIAGLQQMGIPIDIDSDKIIVRGASGGLTPSEKPIFLGNSGTSIRLLTGICALGKGEYILDGTERMRQRPIQDLVDGLTQLGVSAQTVEKNGCPPVRINGADMRGGEVNLNCGTSSQYLSAILLLAPYVDAGVEVNIVEGPVSKPYVDMTVDVMTRLGVRVERDGYRRFYISGRQVYHAGNYEVEPDCSQAGYFWGAAAISGKSLTVKSVTKQSRQGDVRFADVLGDMGCQVTQNPAGICVSGKSLSGVDVDMADMPDMVPTLAVVAAFAHGKTRIRNVPHLKAKESDRLGSVVAELRKMGIAADCTDSGMEIIGGRPKGAQIKTYDDHRIAMSFAMAGLRVPGIFIEDEACVGKSFPNFWDVFNALY